jgi:hypothetical protein
MGCGYAESHVGWESVDEVGRTGGAEEERGTGKMGR